MSHDDGKAVQRILIGRVRVVRLHYPDGKTVSEPIARFASANRRTIPQALELLESWVRDGSLRRRPDGGFDVKRHRPRQRPVE